MRNFFKKNKINILSLGLLLLLFIPAISVVAANYKAFLVEKVFGDELLITDGFSQYIIEYNFDCYSSDFSEGSYIHVDCYFSPGWGDTIITEGIFGTETCEVTDSEEVDIKQYLVVAVIDNKDEIIVEDKYGTKYLVEYGIGCGLSMWRYEGKYIDIDIGGSFLNGISDRIYLFDSDDDCKVWDAEEISSDYWSSGGGDYTIDTCDLISCPLNSSCSDGQCFCDDGYINDGKNCITYTQNCQNKYGINSYGDKNHCYCKIGYEWNSTKTACAKSIICPSNSTKIGNSCICKEGHIMRDNKCITYTNDCNREFGANVYGAKGDDGNSLCYCNTGYEWNKNQTACIKSVVCPLNSKKINNKCVCNQGYIMKNNKCITPTDDCINEYGLHVYGEKKDGNSSFCYCINGYKWNSSQTACIKMEISKEKEELQIENIIPKNEENPLSEKEQQQSQIEEQSELGNIAIEKIQEQEKKQKRSLLTFIASVFDSFKSFFVQFFK